jgi:hypothetical protein
MSERKPLTSESVNGIIKRAARRPAKYDEVIARALVAGGMTPEQLVDSAIEAGERGEV